MRTWNDLSPELRAMIAQSIEGKSIDLGSFRQYNSRIFYDTEFIEHGAYRSIDFISLGAVRELDGKEFYAIIDDSHVMEEACQIDFHRKNVIPSLPYIEGVGWDQAHPDYEFVMPRRKIARLWKEFVLGVDNPELWAYYAAYDHVVVSQLYGRMIDLPGLPKRTSDIMQRWDTLGRPELPRQQSGEHNALEDARHNQAMMNFLDSLE